jgi:hypothetical protein
MVYAFENLVLRTEYVQLLVSRSMIEIYLFRLKDRRFGQLFWKDRFPRKGSMAIKRELFFFIMPCFQVPVREHEEHLLSGFLRDGFRICHYCNVLLIHIKREFL